MSAKQPNDRFKRHKTRHRGITYRERADGGRTYFVTAQGRYVVVEGGEREALAKQAELRTRIARGERVASGNVLFEDVAEEWLARKRVREKTRVGYRSALDNHILPFFGGMKIGRIRVETIAEFVATMERKQPRGRKDPKARLKGWTIQGALTPLSGIFKYAVRRGYVGFNPVQQLERDERPRKIEREKRILDPGAIAALLAAAPDESPRLAAAAERYRPILFTAVYTGLRLGELLGLRWGDVDFTNGVLRVRRQVTQKGEAVAYTKTEAGRREVDLDPEVATALATLWASSSYSGDDDYVFASTNGTPLNYRNVERRGLDVAPKSAGIRGEPKLRFHDLRHTYASMLIDGGATPEDVCAQMGHANPSITMRTYTHQFNARKARSRVLAAISPNVVSLWRVEVGTDGNGAVEPLPENGLAKQNG